MENERDISYLTEEEVRLGNYKIMQCINCGYTHYAAMYVLQEWNHEGCPTCCSYESKEISIDELTKDNLISMSQNLLALYLQSQKNH